MDGTAWFIGGAMVIGFLVLFALTLLPGARGRTAARLVRSVGIGLPPQLQAEIGARVVARQRASALGGAVAVALAVAFFALAGTESSPLTGLLIVGGAFVGIAVGAGLSSLVSSAKARPAETRVARLRAVTVGDYLAPIEFYGARVVVTIAVAVLVVVLSLTPDTASGPGPDTLVVALLGISAAVALALFELVSRRFVDRPQRAGTPVELAWDDVVRSSILRDLVTAPLLLGVYALLYGLLEFSSRADATGAWVAGLVALFLIIIGLVVFAAVAVASRPQRHVIRRLWPDVGAPLATTEDNA
jgi:hypothetical protein